MRFCDLTDEQLEVEVIRYNAFSSLIGEPDDTRKNAKIVAEALAELLDRRAAMTDDRLTEMGLAFELAAGVIESHCTAVELPEDDDDYDFNTWYDLDTASVEEIEQEVDYLDSRRLLLHHPSNPRWVSFCDEGEPI